MDDANLGGCYPPWLPSLLDNILLDLHNSSHRTQPHSVIVKKKKKQDPIDDLLPTLSEIWLALDVMKN